VLDIHAEGVDGLQGFNPFEMGDVKPTIEVLW
jgi:hypothetical protein